MSSLFKNLFCKTYSLNFAWIEMVPEFVSVYQKHLQCLDPQLFPAGKSKINTFKYVLFTMLYTFQVYSSNIWIEWLKLNVPLPSLRPECFGHCPGLDWVGGCLPVGMSAAHWRGLEVDSAEKTEHLDPQGDQPPGSQEQRVYHGKSHHPQWSSPGTSKWHIKHNVLTSVFMFNLLQRDNVIFNIIKYVPP